MKKPGDFYIGAIRNPCNYYVSLWSYCVETPGAGLRKQLVDDPKYDYFFNVSDKTSSEAKSRFREFLHYITGDIGVCSGRFAYAYSVGSPQTRRFSTRSLSHDAIKEIQSELNTFDTSLIDCWVGTETLHEDVGVCLRMLQKERNYIVNWTSFDAKMERHHSNPSSHGQCKDYYDKDLEKEIVEEKDSVFFTNFGYDKCCDAPSHMAAHFTHKDLIRHKFFYRSFQQ